ncbi:MAG: type ISP restriction/modification enzyme, partial [Terriglobales bacterium]
MPKIRSLESGTSRRENITDWALNQFRRHYHDLSITKWDTFHYVYAVLHHPAYRERYAANLKRESPCIPFIGAHGVTTAADFVITTEDASPEEGSVVSSPNHDLGAPSSPSFGEGGITTSADHRESLKGRAFRRADIDATTNPRAALPRAGAQPQAERQKESAATNPDATIFHAFAA